MTREGIQSTPTWQQKKAAEAEALIIKAQELGAPPELKAALLKSMLPSFVEFPAKLDLPGKPGHPKQSIFLSPEDKQLVILYAFIGLSELVSASGEMQLTEIWRNCIDRSIFNLRKDGLLR
jgi:hypothetical protein